MKRLMIFLTMAAIICSVGFAEETSDTDAANFNYRIFSGGFWSCAQDVSGGFGEFGVNLLPQEKCFVLRNCIYVQGEGGALGAENQLNFGGLEIGDKLILGGRVNCSDFIVRSYGFSACSFGLFACEDHSFFSAPFMINLTFGGGFEFQFASHTAFVIEFGGSSRFLAGGDKSAFGYFSKGSPVLTIGYRLFR